MAVRTAAASERHVSRYAPMSTPAMTIPLTSRRTVFVDVDTQIDFMLPHGNLYVPGAETIIPNLERLMAFAREHDVPVISSVDAHSAHDEEFRDFSPHCVKGTS